MLDSLRAFGRTWPAKIFFGVLVMSFALFGISNVITDLGSNTVARVGGTEISITEFQRAYNAQLNAAAQQLGAIPTPEEALALGIPSSVISQLASQAAVNEFGERLGLGVSQDRLKQMAQADPSFSGLSGQYDPETARRVLQQMGYTEAEYADLQAGAARRQQVAMGLFADSAVPQAAKDLFNRYSADKRTIDYFVVSEQAIPPVAEPTEEELAAYLKEHQGAYRTEETRSVQLIVLTPEVLAATKTIGDEQIAAEFERTKDSRVKLERRDIVQVQLPNEATIGWFERGKASGKTFEELVVEAGLTVTALGTLGKAEITDAALAEAAFGLAQGDFAIIEGVQGKRAVTVTAIEPGGQITLEEAREDIAKSLALAEAKNEYVDILDQIEELRASFQPIAQIAERYGFEVVSVDVTAAGAALESVRNLAEENRAKVASAIFAAEEGKLAPSIVLGANNHVWFDLAKVEPARDQTLDEVRDRVAADWTKEKTNDAIVAEVERLVGLLEQGQGFADVAVAANQFPVLSQPMTRTGDGTNVLNAAVASAAFAGGEGHFGSALNGDGDYVIFQVVEITPAEANTVEEIDTFIEEAARDTLYADFIAGVRDEAGLRINQQALNQILSLSTGN